MAEWTQLDELNDRLSARSLLNSALDWWESRGVGSRPVGATKDTYQSVARYLKENPIPSLLVGAGVAWMIIEATTEEDDKRESRVGRVGLPHEGSTASSSRAEFPETQTDSGSASGLVENAKNKLGEAKEAVSGVAGTVKDKVAEVGDGKPDCGGTEPPGTKCTAKQFDRTNGWCNLQRGYQSSAAEVEMPGGVSSRGGNRILPLRCHNWCILRAPARRTSYWESSRMNS